MQKLKCPTTGKGVWIDKAMMEQMKTLKLLGVNIIHAPAVSASYTGKTSTHHRGNYYSVEYLGNNKWQFLIETINQGMRRNGC